ncbi:MAG: MMPL family transporter, partial [Clostridiales bacterium]|nr:MMPL family transporter [Clostridiales bacterium]
MIKKIAEFIINKRYFILVAALILVGLSVYWTAKVSVNYDMTKYLSADSDTTKALGIMGEEFGISGTADVMIKNVTFDEGKELQRTVAGIDGVKTVNFFNTPNYFIDADGDGIGDAGLRIFFDNDDFSPEAHRALEEVRSVLEGGGYEIYFSGATNHNLNMKNRIEGQIPTMMVLSIIILIVILFLTSSSWFEPLLFGATVGAAVLINMGTNYLLGEISYVTRSVASILQLALAIDYSIILLHQYKEELALGLNPKDAMKSALARSLAPVSSSSLTTMAGLAAIMFMSFRLGFDIGIVLVKAILCSVLSVFFLMPCLTVIFSKWLKKFEHKPLFKEPDKRKGRYINFLYKYKKLFAALFLVVFIGVSLLQTQTQYFYLEEDKNEQGKRNEVEKVFGLSNLMMVIAPNSGDDELDYARQSQLIDYLKTLYSDDGRPIYRDALSIVTTVRRPVNAEDAAILLNMDYALVRQLFGMYYLENGLVGGGADKLTLKEFVAYADDLISGREPLPLDVDLDGILGGAGDQISAVRAIIDIMDSELNAAQMHYALSGGVLPKLGISADGFSLAYVEQIYAMYYKSIGLPIGSASLKDIIIYASELVEAGDSADINLAALLDDGQKNMILLLGGVLKSLDREMTADEAYGVLSGVLDLMGAGGAIDSGYVEHIYAYYQFKNLNAAYELSLVELIGYFYDALHGRASSTIDISALLGGEITEYIDLAYAVFAILDASYTPEELIGAVGDAGIFDLLGMQASELGGVLGQIYGMYYFDDGRLGGEAGELSMKALISYLAALSRGDEGVVSAIDVGAFLDDGTKNMLIAFEKLIGIVSSSYTYQGLYAEFNSQEIKN